MNTFSYSKVNFVFTIILPCLIMASVLVWGIFGIMEDGWSNQNKLAVVAIPILLLSTFIGIHNPSTISITNQTITFQSFGNRHLYNWNEVKTLKIRRYDYAGKTYIRIGAPRLFGGRYWVSNKMTNYHDLLEILIDKSERIERDETLKMNI